MDPFKEPYGNCLAPYIKGPEPCSNFPPSKLLAASSFHERAEPAPGIGDLVRLAVAGIERFRVKGLGFRVNAKP